MKIACVLKTNEGGIWAVPQMEELRNRGHDVVFVIPGGDGKLRRLLDARNFPIVESKFDFSFRPSRRLLRGLRALRRQLTDLGVHAVIYHLYASALAVRFSTLGRRLRRVHMVAGPLYLDAPLIRRVERLLCRLDDVVIGGSAHTARRYIELGMPPARVRAIPYGVDLRRFAPETVEPETSIDPSRFTAVMVAYVYAPKSSVYPGVGIKGHETLLAAWERFIDDYPDSDLVLVGAGFDAEGERHRTALKARHPHLARNVRWIDSVDDVRPWYVASDVSISPSLSENHGAALEASAMECPSIVSDAGALPEAVLPGQSGWIFPAGRVKDLGAALRQAHEEWLAGSLRERGVLARELMFREFDQETCSKQVANVVLCEDLDGAR